MSTPVPLRLLLLCSQPTLPKRLPHTHTSLPQRIRCGLSLRRRLHSHLTPRQAPLQSRIAIHQVPTRMLLRRLTHSAPGRSRRISSILQTPRRAGTRDLRLWMPFVVQGGHARHQASFSQCAAMLSISILLPWALGPLYSCCVDTSLDRLELDVTVFPLNFVRASSAVMNVQWTTSSHYFHVFWPMHPIFKPFWGRILCCAHAVHKVCTGTYLNSIMLPSTPTCDPFAAFI